MADALIHRVGAIIRRILTWASNDKATLEVTLNGVAVPSGSKVTKGKVLSVVATPKTGYQNPVISANGVVVDGSSYIMGKVPTTLAVDASVIPYSLSISRGTGTDLTVSRQSSPLQHAGTGTLNSGDTLYYGDVIVITSSAQTGYSLSSLKVNSSNFTSGNTYTVKSNVTVASVAAVLSYKLSISQGTGSTISVKRTASPKAGAGTGVYLSNNADIYYSDELEISFAANQYYNLNAHTVNGDTFTSGNKHTVTAAVSVVSSATAQTVNLSFSYYKEDDTDSRKWTSYSATLPINKGSTLADNVGKSVACSNARIGTANFNGTLTITAASGTSITTNVTGGSSDLTRTWTTTSGGVANATTAITENKSWSYSSSN